MNQLTIEKTYRVLLGDTNRFRIMIIGAGGTGSALASLLASLAYHAKQKGTEVNLTLVDHDMVEMKNCGRQNLAVQSAMLGGIPKVADLALRLNAAYGLDITAWPQPYAAEMASEWTDFTWHNKDCVHIIIGCVDNYQARREIAKTVGKLDGRLWCIDSGNDRYNGQVLVGNMVELGGIQTDKLGLCSGLPSPYVQEPALLEPDPNEKPLSCAEMTLTEEQSLMVNRLAATIVAQFVAEMVLHREVKQMATCFNLAPPTMSSRLITQGNLNSFLPVVEV